MVIISDLVLETTSLMVVKMEQINGLEKLYLIALVLKVIMQTMKLRIRM